jgi:hypothetical protein
VFRERMDMEVKSKPSKDLVYKHIQRYYKASIEENVKVKVMNNTTYYGDKSRIGADSKISDYVFFLGAFGSNGRPSNIVEEGRRGST